MQESGARLLSSTAYPFAFTLVSSIDHTTPATGKTPTVTIRKSGGAFGAPAGAVTEIGSGWYELAGNATDRNTLGECLIHVTATGCDTLDRKIDIVGYNPFDAFWGIPGFDKLQAFVSAVATFVNPLNADGTVMYVTSGDEYYAADGRAFSWSLVGWPSLAGATAATYTAINPNTRQTLLQVPITILNATDLRLELSAANTRLFVLNTAWEIAITLADGHVIRPKLGIVQLSVGTTS